jgi:transcriptional regulator with XRE-family HTH domain
MNFCASEQRLEVGKRARELRQELGIAQEELAARAELHRNYVGSIEHGEGDVGVDAARRSCSHPCRTRIEGDALGTVKFLKEIRARGRQRGTERRDPARTPVSDESGGKEAREVVIHIRRRTEANTAMTCSVSSGPSKVTRGRDVRRP